MFGGATAKNVLPKTLWCKFIATSSTVGLTDNETQPATCPVQVVSLSMKSTVHSAITGTIAREPCNCSVGDYSSFFINERLLTLHGRSGPWTTGETRTAVYVFVGCIYDICVDITDGRPHGNKNGKVFQRRDHAVIRVSTGQRNAIHLQKVTVRGCSLGCENFNENSFFNWFLLSETG